MVGRLPVPWCCSVGVFVYCPGSTDRANAQATKQANAQDDWTLRQQTGKSQPLGPSALDVPAAVVVAVAGAVAEGRAMRGSHDAILCNTTTARAQDVRVSVPRGLLRRRAVPPPACCCALRRSPLIARTGVDPHVPLRPRAHVPVCLCARLCLCARVVPVRLRACVPVCGPHTAGAATSKQVMIKDHTETRVEKVYDGVPDINDDKAKGLGEGGTAAVFKVTHKSTCALPRDAAPLPVRPPAPLAPSLDARGFVRGAHHQHKMQQRLTPSRARVRVHPPVGRPACGAAVARQRLTGTKLPFALKVVKLNRFTEPQREILLREIGIIKMLDHPNIIKVHEVFRQINVLYQVMELCTGGDLFDNLVEQPGELQHLLWSAPPPPLLWHAAEVPRRVLASRNWQGAARGAPGAWVPLVPRRRPRHRRAQQHRVAQLSCRAVPCRVVSCRGVWRQPYPTHRGASRSLVVFVQARVSQSQRRGRSHSRCCRRCRAYTQLPVPGSWHMSAGALVCAWPWTRPRPLRR